ncbi:MAG: hypothetical protein HY553_03555 [Elusimicrobia bacterium]|nr:hypothetical protein [Elusimicrobiota bacterium]
MSRPSRSRRKAQAVAAVLGATVGTALLLRWLLVEPRRRVPPPEPPPQPARRAPAPEAPAGPSWPQDPTFELLARLDPRLAPAAWGLFAGPAAARKAAALELSGHFVASDTLTGLCPEAPDTLWVLSEAIRRRAGMPAVMDQLYRNLRLLAELEDYEKDDFVDQLPDPLAIYVPLAISHTPHVRESRRMFAQFRRLLAPAGETVTGWIREHDPELRFAPSFLLRLNAYEALVPYLRDHPPEARGIAPMVFLEKRADAVDLTADQIQNIFDSLASDPKGRESLAAFAEGSLTQLAMASGPVREKITLFLHLNWKKLPPEAREAAEFVIGPPREDPEGKPSPRVPPPYSEWPKDEWRFSQHFAEEVDLRDWERFFLAKGYKREPADEEATVLARQVPGGPRLVLTGYVYTSLETGMLVGPTLRRFQAALARDVRDPAVQGVFVRAHAQFPRTPAFANAKPGPKLWYDGSCRGAWDLNRLSALCPQCALVGNVGSGRGAVNNPMIWALLEGLARREDWDRLADRVKAAVPEYHTRLIGPWTTPFSRELKTLKKPKAKRKK